MSVLLKNCGKRAGAYFKRILAAAERKNILCLKATGSSMEPTIKAGDTIFVHKRKRARSGNLIAALVDKKNLSLFRLKLCGKRIELTPIDNTDTMKVFEGKERKRIKILGVVESVSRKVT